MDKGWHKESKRHREAYYKGATIRYIPEVIEYIHTIKEHIPHELKLKRIDNAVPVLNLRGTSIDFWYWEVSSKVYNKDVLVLNCVLPMTISHNEVRVGVWHDLEKDWNPIVERLKEKMVLDDVRNREADMKVYRFKTHHKNDKNTAVLVPPCVVNSIIPWHVQELIGGKKINV